MDFPWSSAAIWVSTASHPAFPDGCLPGSNARESTMTDPTIVPMIEYEQADAAVRAVYDDMMHTRGTDWINNLWCDALKPPVDAAFKPKGSQQ